MRVLKESLQDSILDYLILLFTRKDTVDIINKDEFIDDDITNAVLANYGVLHDGKYYAFNEDRPIVSNVPLPDFILNKKCYSNISIEGDLFYKGDTLNARPTLFWSRLSSELPKVTKYTKAYYDILITVFTKDNKKVATFLNEMSISLISKGYCVSFKPIENHWVLKDTVNRVSDLDFTDNDASPSSYVSPVRFSDIEVLPAYHRVTRGKASPDRFKGLDLNARLEAMQLTFAQDQTTNTYNRVPIQLDNKTTTSTQTDTVSTSVTKQVDKMSAAKALDIVESAKKGVESVDFYGQCMSTDKLCSKWFSDDVVLVDNFKVIDDIHDAAIKMRRISQIEKELANTKSRAAITKLNTELSALRDDLNMSIPLIKDNLSAQSGYDKVAQKADQLEKLKDDYLDDYQEDASRWNALKDKFSKMSKVIEQMEALRLKYNPSLPSLLPKYKNLVSLEMPSLVDLDDVDTFSADVVYSAWYQNMVFFKKALESFYDSFSLNYDSLSRILSEKAYLPSLF